MAERVARGDIRLFRFAPPDKRRPVVVLTRDSIVDRLARITVAPVTSTIRGVASEVTLGTEDGLKQADAVGKVGGLNGAECLEPQRLEVSGQFFFGDLGHGDKMSAVFRESHRR